MLKPQIYFLLVTLCCACSSSTEKEFPKITPFQDSLVPIQITIVNDLPDSLQPTSILLAEQPKPLKIIVPTSDRSAYSSTNSSNIKKTINIESPTKNSLPVLLDKKGNPILDKEGYPFILGDGGKSHFSNFTTDDGLPLDAIYSSLMDKSGNLWFSTRGGGVSKYDGQSFTNFSTNHGLAGNYISSILEDQKGNFWFGTIGDGLSKYDGESFTNYTVEQGLVGNSIWTLFEDKRGNIWLGASNGKVSTYDGQVFIDFTPNQELGNTDILTIYEDRIGNVWFGTYGDGVIKYNGTTFTTIKKEQGLANNFVYTIFQDKSGNLWFGTLGGGVSKYNGESLSSGQTDFTNYTTTEGLASNVIRKILEDKTGNIWISTSGGGISKYDGTTFTSFTTTQGLANNAVSTSVEDKIGNIWFGTSGGGISRYNGRAITNYTANQGVADNIVWSILEDKAGNLWLGTDGAGVSKYDGYSFTNFSQAQGLAGNIIWSTLEDQKGNLWFGTNGKGVSKYDGQIFTNFTTNQGLADNDILNIHEDKKGNLWFGTYGGGVSKFDGQTFTNFTANQGLANNVVLSILEDKEGHFWFGTIGEGVSRYDGESFINFTSNHGLANNTVNRIFEDKEGNLWFGTDLGVSLLKAETLTNYIKNIKNNQKVTNTIFKTFTTKDGLPNNYVTQIIQLPNDKMGIGTNQGITLFKPSEEFTSLTDIEVFSSLTGYPIKSISVGQNCLYIDTKGIIWAGTGSEKTALVKFDYEALPKNDQPITPIIQRVRINEEKISWYNLDQSIIPKNSLTTPAHITEEMTIFGEALTSKERDDMRQGFGNITFDGIQKFYPIPINLVLPYEHNNITFDFLGVETSRNFMLRYQYFLEGYSKEWSPVTDKTSAIFGNIREGNYTFKLKAKSPEGVWSEPITYSFRVLPPWYRTWWAYSLATLGFLLGLYVFSYWRERALRRKNENLEKMVERRTAELVAEKKEADKQRERSDELLLNILPAEVAEELKTKGSAAAKHFDEVTVMFTDFKGFTQLSEKLSPSELVAEIDFWFKAFDEIITKHNIEKIKTIGDSYMCAGGLPVPNKTNAKEVVQAAIEIQAFIQNHTAQRKVIGKEPFEMRIGIHTGPVVAGIVGLKKFAYDIWGDTVNIAARMEESGQVGKINISGSTYALIKEDFNCFYRGKVQAKNKGEVDMYFVE